MLNIHFVLSASQVLYKEWF